MIAGGNHTLIQVPPALQTKNDRSPFWETVVLSYILHYAFRILHLHFLIHSRRIVLADGLGDL